MIDNNMIEKIIEERKKMHPDDPRIMEKWDELTQIFIQNEADTIEYLEQCSQESAYWISEVFDDIAENLQSVNFIKCIEQLCVKYPDADLKQDVLSAKEFIE